MSRQSGCPRRMAPTRATSPSTSAPTLVFRVVNPRARYCAASRQASSGSQMGIVMSVSMWSEAPPKKPKRGMLQLRARASKRAISSPARTVGAPGRIRERSSTSGRHRSASLPVHSRPARRAACNAVVWSSGVTVGRIGISPQPLAPWARSSRTATLRTASSRAPAMENGALRDAFRARASIRTIRNKGGFRKRDGDGWSIWRLPDFVCETRH